MKRRVKGTFTAVFEKRGRWYVGYVEEIPGVNTQGKTLPEVRRNLKEALQLIIGANRSLATRQRGRNAVREAIQIEA